MVSRARDEGERSEISDRRGGYGPDYIYKNGTHVT